MKGILPLLLVLAAGCTAQVSSKHAATEHAIYDTLGNNHLVYHDGIEGKHPHSRLEHKVITLEDGSKMVVHKPKSGPEGAPYQPRAYRAWFYLR